MTVTAPTALSGGIIVTPDSKASGPRHKGRGLFISADELLLCEPGELARQGCEFVSVQDPVSAGLRIDEDLRLLRFLREITSHTIRLEWTLAGRPLPHLSTFVHLIPPMGYADDAARACVEAWRDGYRYGAFYYRCGPDFVTIKDVRTGIEAAHLTIDGDGSAHFRALADGESLAELDNGLRDGLHDAVEADLAVQGDETFLVLPYRMRHWPVPFLAV
jgi:Family of unknown function (DUF5825)